MVEDNDDDRVFFSRALADVGVPAVLKMVQDAREGVDYLEGQGMFADRSRFPLPDVIVMDLRTPRMDAFEFLLWRNASRFSSLPVVILEGAGYGPDQQQARKLGACLVFEKRNDLQSLASIVKDIVTLSL